MFQVVHFTDYLVTVDRIVSAHDTLSEAQAAHAALVSPNGALIADYLDYGIIF